MSFRVHSGLCEKFFLEGLEPLLIVVCKTIFSKNYFLSLSAIDKLINITDK
jgi:hypothetical protein